MLSNGLGVPIAEHKTETATQSLIFLGIGLDAKSQSLYIPESKRLEVMNMIMSFLGKPAPKVKLWQKLLGKLCHLSQVLVAGRTFLSSVYGSLQGILSQDEHLHRRISKEVCLDLLVWYDFLLKISPGKSFRYIFAKGDKWLCILMPQKQLDLEGGATMTGSMGCGRICIGKQKT